MKRIKSIVTKTALAAALMLTAGFAVMPGVYADTSDCDGNAMTLKSGSSCAQGTETPDNLFGGGGIFNTIVNVILFLVGAISVIMLIYGGIKYTTSAGDTAKVTSAKNTIMYAIVGLIISILAFAIINFVIGSFGSE
ncbi:MAG: pilin [Candidatus Nomurabacteria bacterium]|jgi:hypothetical protein|nr:pilin [Candidatus Nomurabacteria bacterium]